LSLCRQFVVLGHHRNAVVRVQVIWIAWHVAMETKINALVLISSEKSFLYSLVGWIVVRHHFVRRKWRRTGVFLRQRPTAVRSCLR
jgi:hypothetical protein